MRKITNYQLLITNYSRRRRGGFTLVEVLVATVLVIALALGVVGLQYILGQSQSMVWKRYLNVNQANMNIQTLARQLRTARGGDNGAYPLELVSGQEIIFYSDIDFDGQTEKVSYLIDGSNFSKGVIEPEGYPVDYPEVNKKVVIITNYVRNGGIPVFSYYNGDWPEDTQNNPLSPPVAPSNVKLIRLYLRLNTQENQPEKDYVLQSFVQIRMLKENL